MEVGAVNNFEIGTNIERFIAFCNAYPGNYYFHNLNFDGGFIVSYLMLIGWTHCDEPNMYGEFGTIMSRMGKLYCIELCTESGQTVRFLDSLKKIPMSIAAMANAFNLPFQKLEIDYMAHRPTGYKITQSERDYLLSDLRIPAMALEQLFTQGLTRMTAGSDALNGFKDTFDDFKFTYPVLDLALDEECRQSYKGGYTYMSELGRGYEGEGMVFDVNSLYPSIMYSEPLPYGQPREFMGRYTPNPDYPLYSQRLTCSFTLKPNHIPTIQIKNTMSYQETEYLTESDGYTELYLTSIDLEVFFRHYDVTVLSWDYGIMYKAQTGNFVKYIDFWMQTKEQAARDGNDGLYYLAKLMLNSLYGKFATNPDVTGKYPELDGDGVVRWHLGEEETRDPVYTPVGAFITAYGRAKTINAAQADYSRYLYSDTDSVHFSGTAPIDGLEIHDTALGCWAHEATFERCKYIRAKTYCHIIAGETVIKAAGLPYEAKEHITIEDFKPGLTVGGKLIPKYVPGGVVLEDTTFTIM
jgi:hypothetical protein